MQKISTTIFCLLLIAMNSFATIIPGGTITTNTTWTKAGSPYVISGEVTFDINTTLTIQPGVVIRFDSNYSIMIKGKLMMQGSITDSITITTNKTSPLVAYAYLGHYYYGFTLQPSNYADTSYIDYCNFSYAGCGITPGKAVAKIAHSSFKYCFWGIRNDQGDIYISNCSFSYCKQGVNSGKDGANNIVNSSFNHNTDYGIWIWDYNPNNYCANNIFIDNGTGIVRGTYVSNCLFTGNRVRAIESCTFVHHNQIVYNKIGIEVIGDSTTYNCIEFNDIGINNTHFTTYPSVVKNNCIAYNYTSNFIANSSPDIDASNNFWAASDSTTIASHIEDFYKKSYCGKVLFMPFLYSPDSACDTTFLAVTNTKQKAATVKVYPNPISSFFTIDAGTQIIKETLIHNITGSLIFKATANKSKLEINTADFPNGVYLYQIRLLDGSSTTGKILKE